MSRVRSFFLAEADRWLGELRACLDQPPLDTAALYRAARRFRGNAQLARFGDLAKEARELEARLRSAAERAAVPEEEALRRQVRTVLESLERGVEAVRGGRLVEDPKTEARMDERKVEEQSMADAVTNEQAMGGANTDGQTLDGQSDADVVPVDTLEYRGTAALDRALALREPLEDAIVEDRQAGPILDELFDLIRLGAK